MNRSKGPVDLERRAAIIRLYAEERLGTPTIARAFNMSRQNVRQILKRAGVPRRSIAEAHLLRPPAPKPWKRIHGQSAPLSMYGDRRATPEYRCWQAMKSRCYNQTVEAYRHYGGRGITVCEAWLDSFENFLADMGARPSAQHSIDRIDNDGNYEPANCRWATAKEQMNNRRPPTPRTP